jgi:hypothetical protein
MCCEALKKTLMNKPYLAAKPKLSHKTRTKITTGISHHKYVC